MTYQIYLLLHFAGIFLVIASLSGIGLHVIAGGTRNFPLRRRLAMLHGIGLLLIFVAGFGLLAKLGLMHQFPSWAAIKLVIWLILGAMPALFYKRPQSARATFTFMLVLAIIAAALAIYKPGTRTSGSGADGIQSDH